MCRPMRNQGLLDRDRLMHLLGRRGFKSPNVLHHRKGNKVVFHAAVDKVTAIIFPIILLLLLYPIEAPDSLLGNVFGFRQFREQIEDEKNESDRKRKKVKRIVEDHHRKIC